ncbi:PAS domain S-box protein [Methyloterricola oryzae]|uniref:PAS domain S-box protein n=1 Tax=Methyloterricola oryzae TaxID=1495050 RepID=UPI00130197A6|nr:PAS domain S-box protein [Methyloterricola oryzae]
MMVDREHGSASMDADVDFRLLFESSPDLYLVLNAQLKIVAVSDAYTRATLTRRDEILGKTMFQVFPDNPNDPSAEGQRNLRASLQRVLLSGKPDTMPVQKYDIPKPGGEGFEERYWSPMNIPIFGKDGRIAYVLHRAEDLTDFIRVKQLGVEQSELNENLRAQAVKMEVELFARAKEVACASAELKAANEELSRLYAKTLELDELKTRFFANVSHEFRTPLSLMLGPLEDLKAQFAPTSSTPAPAVHERIDLVHRNGLRLLKLVNSLLDFSRIEAGRMDAAYEATDLAAYTTELVSVFSSATEKAGLKLIVSCPAMPEQVYVDRQMWEKVVINLLSNAFKHTFEGEIEVSLHWSGKSVELAVRDTGVGIAADQLEHVFERFHRVPNVRSRSHEGTGIGLALVRELARLHGGDITVTSTPNVGSTFTVFILTGTAHLPAKHIHPAQASSPHANEADFIADEVLRWDQGPESATGPGVQIETDKSAWPNSSDGAHIILADDNADMRGYLARLLQAKGYDVTAVRDGEAALAAVRDQRPDLVLTDIMMPGLDGIGLLGALRENQETSTIPVILLSARAGEEELIEGLNHKADGYLTKPFSARELLAHIGARLEISRLRNDLENQLRTQEAAREFRSLAETLPQIVWATRPDGWNVYHNQRWVEYTGLTLEESYGHGWITAVHPDDKQRAWDAWQRATRHIETYSLEFRLRRADGVYRWWLIRGVPLLNEQGEIQRWYGTCTDIQDLKQAHIAVRESEERLHFALEICNTGAWEVDLETHAAYRSIEHARIFGYADLDSPWSSEKFLGHVVEEDRPRIAALIHDAFQTGSETRFECRIRRTDGEIRWIMAAGRFRVTRMDGNKQVAVGIVQDITERKQAEEMLLAKDLQYRLAIETSVDGFWMADTQGNIHQANEAYARMSGYQLEELTRLRISDLEAKETPEEMAAHIHQIINEGSARFETRHRRKDGSVWPVHVVVTYYPTDSGRFFIFLTDLTARKAAEEALELASSVYQHTSEGMVVTDENNLIIAVNPAFEKLTGYSIDEVRGKNPSILKSGRHDRSFYEGMWQQLLTEGHWSGELWDRRKDGTLYAKDLTINTIPNEEGAIYRFVALFSDITAKKQNEELIWRQANYDNLTKLPNRRMFQDRLEQEAKKANREGSSLAILLIDLDRFKEVNDSLGHEMGDLLLINAAQRIVSCVRDADTVARLGGDEFLIILSELTETGIVERVAQDLLARLAEPFALGLHQAYVSASVGISLYPGDTQSLEALLCHADQAMYAAKGAGRNCFSYFTPSLQAEAEKRMHLGNDLRAALANGQFQVHYQPIVEFFTGRVRKAEALIRWLHPVRGFVSPADFISLAEETGFIIPIGNWVFTQAVEQVKRWRQILDPAFQISVNKSPVQVRSEDKAHLPWIEYLKRNGVDGSSIAVEITEGLLLNAESETNAKLLQMRDGGMQVAIDDFGTGYSSLAYLKKFDIDYLKIDQSFVRNLEPYSDDLALCEAIIVMAHKLGLKVIAEGIETREQRDLLMAAGCDFGQGYLFARPMPAIQFEQKALGEGFWR